MILSPQHYRVQHDEYHDYILKPRRVRHRLTTRLENPQSLAKTKSVHTPIIWFYTLVFLFHLIFFVFLRPAALILLVPGGLIYRPGLVEGGYLPLERSGA